VVYASQASADLSLGKVLTNSGNSQPTLTYSCKCKSTTLHKIYQKRICKGCDFDSCNAAIL